MKISIIIPVFNEEKDIEKCLITLMDQTSKDSEIIIVDDGSTDKSSEIINKFSVIYLHQNHLGTGAARNLGAKNAKGEILVFVDADMEFTSNFIEKLTQPIREKQVIGTFSNQEYVLNKDNIWSKCWNINRNLPIDKMHAANYLDEQLVFRAILKKEFDKVGGFDLIGYIDDHSLSRKLNIMARVARGAILFHKNPSTLAEVYNQARWVGKSEYKNRKIKNELLMRIIALIRYSIFFSLVIGLFKSIKYLLPEFLLFKIVYDTAIEISLLKSLIGEQNYK